MTETDLELWALTNEVKTPRKRRRSKPPEGYMLWQAMKTRCESANHPSFHRYGARGITVCERWRSSFAAFAEDMGPRPAGGSLDRIDNNGNYEPGNCRWATREQQGRNRSDNRRSEWMGKPRLWIEIAIEANVDYLCLRYRLDAGMEVTSAIEECRQKGLIYRERAKGRGGESVPKRAKRKRRDVVIPAQNHRPPLIETAEPYFYGRLGILLPCKPTFATEESIIKI